MPLDQNTIIPFTGIFEAIYMSQPAKLSDRCSWIRVSAIRSIRAFCCAVILCTLGSETARCAAFSIRALGLNDTAHVRSDGYRYSYPEELNGSGHVSGYSHLYNGGTANLGRSAWLYNGTETLMVGLTDAEHTRNDGYRYGYYDDGVISLNEAGQLIGYSNRFNGGSVDLGRSAWLFDGATTINIGLADGEHTRSDGYKRSAAERLNDMGQVVGNSNRYSGGSTDKGRSIWLYDGTATLNIGLVDAEFTRNDGYKYSNYVSGQNAMNEAGQVAGYSTRYGGGSTSTGQSVWLYNGIATINIGLIDAEHTRSDGFRGSYYAEDVDMLNEAGQVIGYSNRYVGGLGRSAWLFNGMTTVSIGLVDAEHTHFSGRRISNVRQLNEAGQVAGNSNRYHGGSADLGLTTWFFNGTTTVKIGLADAEHTRNDGYKLSNYHEYGDYLNDAGQVIGISVRFNGGSTNHGRSAWMYNGTTTVNIGLTDAEHTRTDGYRSSDFENNLQPLTDTGYVAGYALRYNGSASLGNSTWLYNGTTTVKTGLVDLEHTTNEGYKFAGNHELNESGHVVGYSDRYNGGNTYMGRSIWLYNGTTTVKASLADMEHTRNDGYQWSNVYSFPSSLNEAGQVVGYSDRFNGGETKLGQDAWVYDPVVGTVCLQLSVRSDGYAYSQAFLREDGVVVGTYILYDGMTEIGYRALYWSRELGLHDLGGLVEGGLNANGWSALSFSGLSSGLNGIIGGGSLLPKGTSGFLLTAIHPPTTPGDFDTDGDVDGADFVAWQTHFPIIAGATLKDGDADGDGDVDGADFVVWQTSFSSTPNGLSSPVPEPDGIAMVIAACASMLIASRVSKLRTQI